MAVSEVVKENFKVRNWCLVPVTERKSLCPAVTGFRYIFFKVKIGGQFRIYYFKCVFFATYNRNHIK